MSRPGGGVRFGAGSSRSRGGSPPGIWNSHPPGREIPPWEREIPRAGPRSRGREIPSLGLLSNSLGESFVFPLRLTARVPVCGVRREGAGGGKSDPNNAGG